MNLRFGVLLCLYFLAELVFAAAARTVGDPLALLPTSLAAAGGAWFVFLVASRQTHLIDLDRDVALGAAGGAAILLSLTVAYSLHGVSIVTPLVIMKSGGLLVAIAVGVLQGSNPSARSLLVGALVCAAIFSTMWSRLQVDGTAGALVCAAFYLAGYACKLAPVGKHRGDVSFFLSMTTFTIAFALLVTFGALLALALAGHAVMPSRHPVAFLAGLASQGCGVFGGLILLRGSSDDDKARDLASHASLFPIHRSVSLLGAIAAVAVLAILQAPRISGVADAGRAIWGAYRPGEIPGAALLVVALWIGVRR